MGVNSLPKTVTRQRRDCDLNPGPSAPESSRLTTFYRCVWQHYVFRSSVHLCMHVYLRTCVLVGGIHIPAVAVEFSLFPFVLEENSGG